LERNRQEGAVDGLRRVAVDSGAEAFSSVSGRQFG